jgi:hypothetical protein
VQRQCAYVGGGLQPGAALVVVRLAVVTLPPRSTAPAVAGCRLVGCSVVSRGSLRSQKRVSTQSRCGGGVAALPRRPGARSGLPCPVPACGRRGRLAGTRRPQAGTGHGRQNRGLSCHPPLCQRTANQILSQCLDEHYLVTVDAIILVSVLVLLPPPPARRPPAAPLPRPREKDEMLATPPPASPLLDGAQQEWCLATLT